MTKFLLGAGALIAIVSVTPAAAADLAAHLCQGVPDDHPGL